MDLVGGVGHIEASFGQFGDSVNLDAILVQVCTEHAVGLEIIVGLHDGTPT
jgi:hypothetical protein